MRRITRRLLLGTAGVAVFGGATYGVSRVGCSFVPRNHPDFFSLLQLAPDDAAAREIGRLAIVTGAAPGDLESLHAALKARPLVSAALDEGCPTTRKTLVQDQCALDFAEGRVVEIDGWMLSETEVAICAGRSLLTV